MFGVGPKCVEGLTRLVCDQRDVLDGLENVGASLSDCSAAVAELDGREIWSLSAGGALTSLASKQ